jgi:PAS domain S-box-containing protein
MLDTLVRDLAVALYVAIFALLAIRALLDWRERRDSSSLWFSVAFGTLALAIFISIPFQLIGDEKPPALITSMIILLIASHPPSLLRFAGSFGSIGRIEQLLVTLVFAGLGAWSLVLDLPDPGERGSSASTTFSLVFVIAWSVVAVRVTTSLWFSSRGRPGIVRGRMRLLALGVLTLNLALLLSAADPQRSYPITSAVVTACSAMLLLAGFAPFSWLRLLLREPEQQRLRTAVSGLVAVTREEQLFETVLPATRDVVGVRAIAIFHDDMAEPLTLGYDEVEVDEIRQLLDGMQLDVDSSKLVGGRLVRRDVDAWTVVDAPSGGEFFGADELDVLTSINSIARMIRIRLRDAAAVSEHEQRLQTAVDLARLGKWQWQVGSPNITWSPGMRRIFGVDDDVEVTYELYQSLLAPEAREQIAATVEAAIESGESYEVDHRVVRPDGSEAYVHSRAQVSIGDEVEPTRLIGVTMDITTRVRAEQELRHAVEAEREVAARLREVDELKSSILSAVSHELRTPLTSIHGLSVLLQDRIEELGSEQRQEIVDHLVAESERLADLLSDLLDLDRLRRGVVGSIVERRQHSERFELELDDIEFDLDASKLERIVENLVVNAEKYAGEDARVVIRTSLLDDVLSIRVEDDGPGVPDALREAIFEPFNRGDAELGYAPGTGIGLSLVKRFAQLHGGAARVEPSSQGGAAFIVTIPARGVFDEIVAPTT